MPSQILNYIGGSFVPSVLGKYSPIVLPDNEEQGSEASESGIHDLINATQECAKEGNKWEKIPLDKKAEALGRVLASVEANADVFGKLLARYLGYSFGQAKLELKESIKAGQYFVKYAERHHDVPVKPRGLVGVALSSVSPLYYFFSEVYPALLLGNRVIVKPHIQTANVIDGIMRIMQKLELPYSAVQVLNGSQYEIVESMVEHPAVKAFFYYGNRETGNKLHIAALESETFFQGMYGGRNSVILGRDLDFPTFSSELKKVFYSTHFLSCYRGSRVFIPERNYLEYGEKIVKIVEEVLTEKYVGALSTKEEYDLFKMQVISLQKEEVNVARFGKSYADRNGFKVGPRVAEDMKNCSTFQMDQSVGPLITMTRYKTIAEATKFANTTPWGLAGYIFHNDVEKAKEWSQNLKVGQIFINSFASNLYSKPTIAHANSGNRQGLTNWDLYQLKQNLETPIL